MRPVLISILALSLAAPALAETKPQRKKRCAAQGEIVGQAIEMRRKFKSEKKTKAAVLEATDDKLDASVPILVGYVYSLSRKDLKTDVKGAFVKQCSDFKGN